MLSLVMQPLSIRWPTLKWMGSSILNYGPPGIIVLYRFIERAGVLKRTRITILRDNRLYGYI